MTGSVPAMVRKSKLLSALDAHKGRDYEVEKRKKQIKAAEKRKGKRTEEDSHDLRENLEILNNEDQTQPLTVVDTKNDSQEVQTNCFLDRLTPLTHSIDQSSARRRLF